VPGADDDDVGADVSLGRYGRRPQMTRVSLSSP
jgi:hypothetical protein